MEYPYISSTSALEWTILPPSTVTSLWNEIDTSMLTAIDEIPSIPNDGIPHDFANIPCPQWTTPQTPLSIPLKIEVNSNLPTSTYEPSVPNSTIQHLSMSTSNSTQGAGNWQSPSTTVLVPIQPVDSSVDKKYRCPLCKYCGSSKAALGSHQRKHGKYYVCRICQSDSIGPQFQDVSALGSHFGQMHKNVTKKRIREHIDVRFKEQVRIQMPPAAPSATLSQPTTLKTEVDVPPKNLEVLPSYTQEESSLIQRWFLGDDQHLSNLCNKKLDEFRNVELSKIKVENDSLNTKVASLESRLKEKEAMLAEVAWNMENIANFIQEVGGLFVFRKPNFARNNSIIPIADMSSQGGVEQPIFNMDEEGTPNKRARTT